MSDDFDMQVINDATNHKVLTSVRLIGLLERTCLMASTVLFVTGSGTSIMKRRVNKRGCQTMAPVEITS